MKKIIILSGPLGSGKTYLAMAIANFFDQKKVKRLQESSIDKRKINLKDIELLIIDECQSVSSILKFKNVITKNPSCSFIFCTQAYLRAFDNEKINVFNLTYHLTHHRPGHIMEIPIVSNPLNKQGRVKVK